MSKALIVGGGALAAWLLLKKKPKKAMKDIASDVTQGFEFDPDLTESDKEDLSEVLPPEAKKKSSKWEKRQKTLIKLGYGEFLAPDGADGYFGPKTTTAIKQFQEEVGLGQVDGIWGPNTQKAIDSALQNNWVRPPIGKECDPHKLYNQGICVFKDGGWKLLDAKPPETFGWNRGLDEIPPAPKFAKLDGNSPHKYIIPTVEQKNIAIKVGESWFGKHFQVNMIYGLNPWNRNLDLGFVYYLPFNKYFWAVYSYAGKQNQGTLAVWKLVSYGGPIEATSNSLISSHEVVGPIVEQALRDLYIKRYGATPLEIIQLFLQGKTLFPYDYFQQEFPLF